MLKSDKWSLNRSDLLKGLLVAFITAVVAVIGQPIERAIELNQSIELPTMAQIITALKAGVGAGIAYLVKNFSTDSIKEADKKLQKANESTIKRNYQTRPGEF